MKICSNCNYYEHDNTSVYCQKCGTTFPDVSNKKLTGQYESTNTFKQKNKINKKDKQLKRLFIADTILILLFIPLYFLIDNQFGSVIMIYFFAILLMVALTSKMIISKYSDGDNEKVSDINNNKVVETGFILNAIKPR